jgi:hypothetical protein
MLTVLVFLFLLIVFDIAAMRWGFTSSDGPESKEWERRWQHIWLKQYSETRSTSYSAEKRKLEKPEAHLLCN